MTGRLDGLKRVQSTPTGTTPNQSSKRRSVKLVSSRRKLSYEALPTSSERDLERAVVIASSADGWSKAEEIALTEFILLNGDGSRWISTKQVRFWEGASKFIFQRCGSKRTSEYTFVYCVMLIILLCECTVLYGGREGHSRRGCAQRGRYDCTSRPTWRPRHKSAL